MKKVVPFLVGLVPYTFFAGIACMLLLDLDSDVILVGFFGLYLLLGIGAAIVYGFFSDCRSNLWVKLAAVPADGFAIGFIIARTAENNQAAENGAMGVGLSIFMLILFGLIYFLPRVAAMIACAVSCGRDPGVKAWHTLMHLVPGADLVSAALVHRNKQAV